MDAPFRVPRIDEQNYRLVELENGLTALCVSDPAADKAAAACDVRVGSMSDDPDIAGVAHFTEHMLFYSSEKYPQEDEYSKFVSEHGGHTNAYTANESTNYHFDCNADSLEPALDRRGAGRLFSQFFISPLISQDGVEREAQAVDSEHGKNLNSDPWRKHQLFKSTANPAHPFSRFSTGSFDTLITQPKAAGVDSHERVRAFHRRHYSAGVMKLAVVGNQILDELEALVRDKFADVPNTGARPPSFEPDAVTPAQCGVLIRMVPEKDGHSVELQWPTLPEQQHYRAAPSHYVSHLLGHEGKGSAFALLKERGWATGLVAGEAGTSYSSRGFFMCRVDLTEEGQRHVQEVVRIIFRRVTGGWPAYLDLLRAPGGINERTWNEVKQLAEIKFNFSDKMPPYSYASTLAHSMQVYSIPDLLEALHGVPLEYGPELIAQVVGDLTPDNVRVLWSSKTLEPCCTQQEAWYGTKFGLTPLPEDWLRDWRSGPAPPELHLPEPNPFIPSEFEMVGAQQTVPQRAEETPLLSLWHRPEPSFHVPKAALYCHLHLPESYLSPENAVLTQLFSKLVNDYLTEVTYPAELAGLHYSVRSTTWGLLATVYGLCWTSCSCLWFEQPYQVALYNFSILMEAQRWHVDDYQEVLPGLTGDQLEAFYPQLMSRVHVEVFAAGNMSAEAAAAFAQGLEQQLKERRGARPPFASQVSSARIVALQPGRPAQLTVPGPNPANDNSAVVVAFQVGPDDVRSNALTELTTHIGKRDAFYQLRTVEQLGYLVFCTAYCTLSVRNIAFIVQSSARSAEYLEGRVEAFLPLLASKLSGLSDDEFENHVEELCKAKLEKPKRLKEAAARDWREIDDGTLRFDRVDAEVAALRALTRADLTSFFVSTVLTPATRRKLAIRVEGQRAQAAQGAAVGAGEAAVAAEGTGGAAAETPGAAPTVEGSKPVGDEQSLPAVFVAAAVAADGEQAAAVEAIGPEGVYAFKRRQQLYPSCR
eukprot:scaffold12.g7901.t1